MTYPEDKDIRTGKAPRHQKASANKNWTSKTTKINPSPKHPSWYGKNINEMNSSELNEFYKHNKKSNLLKTFNGDVYTNQETLFFPQFGSTTPKEENFLRKLAERYVLLAKKAGYLVKSEEKTLRNRLAINLYIRDTSTSNVSELPSVDYMTLNHLTVLKQKDIDKIIYKR